MLTAERVPTTWCDPTSPPPAAPVAGVSVPRPRRRTVQQLIREDLAWQTAQARAFWPTPKDTTR